MTGKGTFSVVTARPPVIALERLRIDPRSVLRSAQISRHALESIENRLPAQHVRTLWEEAAVAAGDPHFGLHIAQDLPRGTFDVIEYLFASSMNIGEGLARVATYSALIEDPPPLQLVVEPLVARLIRRTTVATPQLAEFAFALIFVRMRQATRAAWRPQSVTFQHEPVRRDRALERLFGCKVSFGADQDEIVFARSVLQLPLVRRDSRLLAILERYASSLLDELPHHGTIVAQTSHAIALEMARRMPTLPAIAAALRVSPRTLQRRLAGAGITLSKLVDDVRRDLALRHIGDAALSITAIGYMLHFSDTTAFTRAFKRWTGLAPRLYRKRVLFGAAS